MNTMITAPRDGTPILAWGEGYGTPQVITWRFDQWVATWDYEPFTDAYAWVALPADPSD